MGALSEEEQQADFCETVLKISQDPKIEPAKGASMLYMTEFSLENETRVGIHTPKIVVRFENLTIDGDVYVGSRALPTLLNSTLNAIEGMLGFCKLLPSKKKVVKILNDVSGIVKPSRIPLLLGPPGSGKNHIA